jgi:hypothetical protein
MKIETARQKLNRYKKERSITLFNKDIEEMMIEFAKDHVKLALDFAQNNVVAFEKIPVMGGPPQYKRIIIKKEHILEVYPLS